SAWQNPYVERLIGTLRRECLDHMVVLNEPHLRRVLQDYLAYYHRYRTHLSLGEGRTAAKTGGALRPGRNRRNTHGRRPASSVHTAGCVRSSAPTLLTGHEVAGFTCSPGSRRLPSSRSEVRGEPGGSHFASLASAAQCAGRTAPAPAPSTWMGQLEGTGIQDMASRAIVDPEANARCVISSSSAHAGPAARLRARVASVRWSCATHLFGRLLP